MSQDEADAAAAANLALFEIVEVRDCDRQVVVGDVQMHSARRRRSSASPVAARRYHVVLHVPAQLSAFALTSSLTSITGSGYSDCVASLPLRNAGFTLNLTNGSGPDSEGHSGARPATLVSIPNNHIKRLVPWGTDGRLPLSDLDLDLGSGHTAYRRTSLIDLYLRTKFH